MEPGDDEQDWGPGRRTFFYFKCDCRALGQPQLTRDLAVAEAGRHVRRGSITVIDLGGSDDNAMSAHRRAPSRLVIAIGDGRLAPCLQNVQFAIVHFPDGFRIELIERD